MKNTDDMSMEDILASIRKYVSSNSEPSKYDKKLVPPSQASHKPNARVIPIKEESEELIEEEIVIKKPIMFEKALSKAKAAEKPIENMMDESAEFSSFASSSSSGRELNLMKFIKHSIEEKIQNWVDQNLEAMVEKHLSASLEKAASEHLQKLFNEEE